MVLKHLPFPRATRDPRDIGDAVHVHVELTLDRRIDVAGVEIDQAILVPVVELALERSRDEGVREWTGNWIVERREDGIAGRENLVERLAGYVGQIDVAPALE